MKIIRQYTQSDFEQVSNLFKDTILNININDYSIDQCKAWVNKSDSLRLHKARLLEQNTIVVEINSKIVGFASLDNDNCLDLLYVHKDYQNNGIGAILCDELEKCLNKITTFASITAKPFFEKRGFKVVYSQQVDCGGVMLENYFMEKTKDIKC